MDTVLQVTKIQKYYGNKGNITKALDNISFGVEKGEFVGIMGASGSGKTTLLNCISTIDTVTSGHIVLGGRDITTLPPSHLSKFRREELGFIFQDFNLLDTLTAFENIALALTILKTPANKIEPLVKDVAKKLEITEVLQKYPYQLSGGQKQRVASARAIVTRPSLILADEPTGALDSRSTDELLKLFAEINHAGQTVVMVTHSVRAASCASRVLFLRDGEVSLELTRGKDTDAQFYQRIADALTQQQTGGERA